MADTNAETSATEATEATAPEPVTQTNPDAKAEGQEATASASEEAGQEQPKSETAAEDWTLTPPEGMDQFKGDFEAFANDMRGWLAEHPEASAKDVLAEAANRQARLVSETQAKMAADHAAQIQKWEAEAKADKTIGGAKFDENVATALKGLAAVADDDFRAILNETGLGNHPAVIRTFLKVGQQIADTPVVKGTPATGAAKTLSAALYG